MATEITFDAQTKLVIPNAHPAELAKQIEARSGGNWAGNFIYLDEKGGESVWVNATTIAFLKHLPD